MKFTIVDGRGNVILGLEEISLEHASFSMLAPTRSPTTLEIGESTIARGLPAGGSGKAAERYWIVRTA
jgi:hypothetical protein